MSLLRKNRILGFVDKDGIYCPDCWYRLNKTIDESLNVFDADDVDEFFEEIICDSCGKYIWTSYQSHRFRT